MVEHTLHATAQVDASAGLSDEATRENEAPWIVVPIDGSACADKAVELAAAVEMVHEPSTLVLVALAPQGTSGAVDLVEVQAVLQVADLGHGAAALQSRAEPAGTFDEEQRAYILWRVLLPAQRQLRATGIDAVLRVLSSGDPVAQLRGLLAKAPSGSVLVLANPYGAAGAFHALVVELVIHPPCTIYVTAPPQDQPGARRELVVRLLRKLWPPRIQ